MLGVVCDDLGRDHGGGMVNKFPACRQVPAPSLWAYPAVAGHESPPFRRDTKRPLRGLHESHGNMTIRPSLFQLFNLSTVQPFNFALYAGRRPFLCAFATFVLKTLHVLHVLHGQKHFAAPSPFRTVVARKRDPPGRRGEDAAPPVVLRAGRDALGGAASRRAPA